MSVTPTFGEVTGELDWCISQLRKRTGDAVTLQEKAYWSTYIQALADFRTVARSEEFSQRCGTSRAIKQSKKFMANGLDSLGHPIQEGKHD